MSHQESAGHGEQKPTLSGEDGQQTYGFYLAVLPPYRTKCMSIVRASLGGRVFAWVSDAHLDTSVKTDSSVLWYEHVRMLRLLQRKVFLQLGKVSDAIRMDNLIVDLNPRSLTAWWLLLSRRVLRRRTLVWGHLYPQAGASSLMAGLRRSMRTLANGTVTYTYTDHDRAVRDIPSQPVWVAPNALYEAGSIQPAYGEFPRNDVLYVGRLTEGKKVSVLIKGFAALALQDSEVQLTLVGDGRDRDSYVELTERLGIQERVVFTGWIDSADALRTRYATAFAAVSPGFLGLGITQALGFGVPMVISKDERHSPEIELASWGATRWFTTDDPLSLRDQLLTLKNEREGLPLTAMSERVRETYSADTMAKGLIDAMLGERGKTHE